MKPKLSQRMRLLWRAEFFSPKDFVRRAVLISIVFWLAHAFGLRQFTSVLNGTMGSLDMSWQQAAVLGGAYILLYLAWVLVVPTLLLAAGILALARRFNMGRNTRHEP